ncbi:hypothetical protein ABT300_43430 [Streptomyces sp. NPDC001027]|uniref:hypothetical protein n=1 Tax=Streptomyces sp. NPDC001027 TaxID=3154771 RepID=UPI0033167788
MKRRPSRWPAGHPPQVRCEARTLALAPALSGTPLAKRPYDLRHSALSTRLCAGADPDVADPRTGNGVELLLSLYPTWLYDRQTINNQRTEGLLSVYDQPPEPEERDEGEVPDMGRGDLADAEWERLQPFLPVSSGCLR